jgi:hypothetical protein
MQVPLLALHELPPKPIQSYSQSQPQFHIRTANDSSKPPELQAVEFDLLDSVFGSQKQKETKPHSPSTSEDYTHSKSCKDRLHPYVITRTHLRMITETRTFKEDVFISKQKDLLATACGGTAQNDQRASDRANCTRNYAQNGHWETVFEVMMNTGERELRYAPYLDDLHASYGPKVHLGVE